MCLNVLGDQQTIKYTGKDTGGVFMQMEGYNEPGMGIPLHSHENEDEIFHVLEGEMEFVVDGASRVLKAGDMLFAPRRIPHTWKVVGEQKARVVVTAIPSGIESMFEELHQLTAQGPTPEKAAAICERYGITFH